MREARPGRNIIANMMARNTPTKENRMSVKRERGNRFISNLEPSNGGMGIRLNSPRNMFMYIIQVIANINVPSSGANLTSGANNAASRKFPAGPAKATFVSPYFLSLKFKGLYGTGLAYPINPPTVKSSSNGNSTVPNKSICFNGLRVNRPNSFAVGSPK